MERGVITVIPLVVHKCFCSSLLDYLSKPFPTLPLSWRGRLGGEFFFIFYDSTNAPHFACKASAHDVRSVSTIIENGRKGYFLQTIRSRMIVKQSQYASLPNPLSYREEECWKQFAYK